jgi:uridine phosphorylase
MSFEGFMMDRIKNELLNLGLKFISIDEKIVRIFLETSPSNVNEIVIMPAVKLVMKKIVNKLQNKRVYGRVYNGILNGVKVSVVRSLVGCPNCAIAVECLKRCKTKIIIRTDFCGGIQSTSSTIEIGDIIIPNVAYCGDGTSPHYIMKYPELSTQLESILNPVSRFQKVISGNENVFLIKPFETLKELLLTESKAIQSKGAKELKLWTTDALFCETYDFINALKTINVQSIDMESSILFLLGKLYNLKTASILSISDLPGDSKYDFLESNEIHPNMESGIDNLIKILIHSLPRIQMI